MDDMSLYIQAPILANNILPLCYIDPVSGSILLQYLIAAIVGAAFFFRKTLYNISKSLGKLFRRRSKPE